SPPLLFFSRHRHLLHLHPFPTRRSSDLSSSRAGATPRRGAFPTSSPASASKPEGFTSPLRRPASSAARPASLTAAARKVEEIRRSEEHTSELQSLAYLVCRLLLEKKKKN